MYAAVLSLLTVVVECERCAAKDGERGSTSAWGSTGGGSVSSVSVASVACWVPRRCALNAPDPSGISGAPRREAQTIAVFGDPMPRRYMQKSCTSRRCRCCPRVEHLPCTMGAMGGVPQCVGADTCHPLQNQKGHSPPNANAYEPTADPSWFSSKRTIGSSDERRGSSSSRSSATHVFNDSDAHKEGKGGGWLHIRTGAVSVSSTLRRQSPSVTVAP